jgi:ribosome-associated protein
MNLTRNSQSMSDWEAAVQAAQSRKAEDILVLDIQAVSSLTDKFILCAGANPKQVQAISDAIEEDLRARGARPFGIEGYANAEWILMDYGDLVVHIFSPAAREYYALDRLWRGAPRVEVPEVIPEAALV